MHAPLTGICRTVYDQEAFAANWPHTSTKYQSTRWEL
jgi:hypothetical protein